MAKKGTRLAVAPKPTGRPSSYTPELGEKICDIISTHTCSLTAMIEAYDFFPADKCTIYRWMQNIEAFGHMYDHAKRRQADIFIQEILEIADDNSDDKYAGKGNPAAVNRSRLMVDTRKWIACKVLPKVYGDLLNKGEDKDKAADLNAQLSEIIVNLLKQNEREY